MKNNNGFTLVEVLVSVLILSTGLLGLVGLQAAGVKNIVGSYNRTQASNLAYSMADKIRANVADITAATITGGTSKYLTVGTDPTTAVAKPNCLTTAGCSVAEMAENDLYEWNLALQGKNDLMDTNSNGLSKTATITFTPNPIPVCPQAAPAPIQITIAVSWTENVNKAEIVDKNNDGIQDAIEFKTAFQVPRGAC